MKEKGNLLIVIVLINILIIKVSSEVSSNNWNNSPYSTNGKNSTYLISIQ